MCIIKTTVVAAVAAASFALAVPGTAEAHMANPGFNAAAPSATLNVQYHHDRYYRRHHRYERHRSRRYRHCWNERVRVRVPGDYFVWRTHRRCG